MTAPGSGTTPPTRRAAREEALLDTQAAPIRHARERRATRIAHAFGAVIVIALVVGSAAALVSALTGTAIAQETRLGSSADDAAAPAPLPAAAQAIPVPSMTAAAAATSICALAGVQDGIAGGDDEAVIAAVGGGEAFRAAVVAGEADCVRLDDPARLWVVIDKIRPYDPLDYAPSPLVMPEGVRSLEGGALRADAAAALSAMARAAREEGAGEIALLSGYRSFSTQQSSYGRQVATRGIAGADQVSARPGFSEHQSGITGDVVACDGGCGTLDDLAGTAQGAWIVENAWRFGWIVRYEEGHTDVTGYLPEPWHLRYLGPQLAQAYHDGGWHTLEEFFGLPPAPDYAS